MAMGIPCITTSSVNAAIGAEHKKNILIANNNDQFVEAIFSLLYDKKLYQKISLASRIFVKENFSWESSLNNLRSLLNSKQ
jgi:glycosyltransferase involved in cell wall biosynthesis